jgi:hypothetical protein
MRNPLLPIAILVLLVASTAVGGIGCSSQSNTTPFGVTPAVSTPVISIVNTIDDAFFLARVRTYVSRPPIDAHDPKSVNYVETTFGQARTAFHLNAAVAQDYPDSAHVWVIVAYGDFALIGNVPTPVPHTTVWLVFVEGHSTQYGGLDDERYDLSQLGTVKQVPLPLPPLPTPTHFSGG